MDKRCLKTENDIKQAFESLITQTTYDDITIQNILDFAHVGRATFYAHFKSKDDVLKGIVSDIFEHLAHPGIEEHHNFTGDQDYLHTIIHMLYHFSEDKQFLNAILQSSSQNIFLNSLTKHLYLMNKRYVMSYYHVKDVPESLVITYLASSLKEIILWWITKDGCIESPQDIAYYYFKLVMPSLTLKNPDDDTIYNPNLNINIDNHTIIKIKNE